MASITIDLGTITIEDNAEGSGKLTQQNFKDWLDRIDKANAGSDYVNRMRKAVRIRGIRGVQESTLDYVIEQAQAQLTTTAGIITETE